jgi:hypothetical protein
MSAATSSSAAEASAMPRPRGWLYSPAVDVSMLMVPLMVALGAYGIEMANGGGARLIERDYAMFIAQFVLGNTTHTILTFLLIGLRRDLLSPVPGQKNILVFGSLATFVASFALFWVTTVTFPKWIDFGITIGFIFAQHHRLSQVKGLWALYSLRSKQPPAPLERKIQSTFVPLGLLMLVARLLCFPRASHTSFATLVPIPGIPAPLDFTGVYLLVAGYLVFAAVGLYALSRAGASLPKRLYIATHFGVVAFTLYSPIWGSVITSGIHGLEYYLLSARMLAPREGEGLRLSRIGVWGVMLTAMAPAIVVGVLNSPLSRYISFQWGPLLTATLVVNSIVMAHYFADAFLYRLRIPEVRKVVLGRMRF